MRREEGRRVRKGARREREKVREDEGKGKTR